MLRSKKPVLCKGDVIEEELKLIEETTLTESTDLLAESGETLTVLRNTMHPYPSLHNTDLRKMVMVHEVNHGRYIISAIHPVLSEPWCDLHRIC